MLYGRSQAQRDENGAPSLLGAPERADLTEAGNKMITRGWELQRGRASVAATAVGEGTDGRDRTLS